jgi:transposase
MCHTTEMAQHITLTEEERTELLQLIKSGKHSARVMGRARILLLLDRSQGQKRKLREIADAMLTSIGTISNVKRRYMKGGLDYGLHDRPRPGAKPKIDGEVEAHLIALVCSDPPEGQERWTLRLLAEKLVELELVESISHVAVGDALKKTNLSLGK